MNNFTKKTENVDVLDVAFIVLVNTPFQISPHLGDIFPGARFSFVFHVGDIFSLSKQRICGRLRHSIVFCLY
jgi:hypothetical protein